MILTVEKMVNGGYGLARSGDGKVILVEGAYPGEEVLVRVTRDKKEYAFARVLTVLKRSEFRRKPRCRYFGRCGGCQFMDVDYGYQLELKRDILVDSFRGGVDVEETVPSDFEYGYRTKMEFALVGTEKGLGLGLKRRYSHDVVPLRECPLAPERANAILRGLPAILDALEIPIYDFRRKRGILKHVVVRHAFTTDQTMLILVTKTEHLPRSRELTGLILRRFPWIHSVIQVMNSKDNVVLRGPYRTLYGEGVIAEEIGWETYQIPPTAFFQSNTNVAEKLADRVVAELELTGRETVLDLYSGLGFFSLKIARGARKVFAVESNRVSVKAGKANANISGVRNVEFVEADVGEFLKNFEGKIDAVVLDPPRSGAGGEVVERIVSLKPRRVIYVSCEPSTLVRDVGYFQKFGYTVLKVVPFDMFPQTFHVESMAVLGL